VVKPSYVALHCHSTYSFMDGVGTIEEWVKGAKEKGVAGLAITDHGDASSMLELYGLGKKHGLPVVLGCEFYIAMSKEKDKNDRYSHVVVWAKNEIGYKNICRLTYLSYQDENFYYKPRITFDDLVKHKEGLIVGSACVKGVIAKYINDLSDVDNEDAINLVNSFKEAFGEDFYLEIQHGDLTYEWDEKKEQFYKAKSVNIQETINRVICQLGKKCGVKVIATPDAHMIDKDQKIVQDVQLKNYFKDKRMYHEIYYLPTREEFIGMFNEKHPYIPNEDLDIYLDNTYEILNKCKDLNLKFDYNLPKVDAAKVHGIWGLIEEKGIIDMKNEVYTHRIKDELEVIINNGVLNLLPYFIVLEELVEWCERNDILVGPGRGSAAGCLLNYALGITKVDPIKYGLPFSRFLNLARVQEGTLPDIDLDFSDQQVVKDYLVKKYGREYVFNICVNQTLKARSAFKDIIRVMAPEVSADKANQLSKMIIFSSETNQKQVLKESLNKNPKLKSFLINNREVFIAITKLIGQVRQRGTHPSAVVMSKVPVYEVVPVAKNRNSGEYVTQYTMEWCEKAGLIKNDILGLKTLKDVSGCRKLIMGKYKKDIDVFNLDFEDEKVFKEFEKCNTDTVFQFNTDLVKGILGRVKIKSLEDLSVVTSLGRPGPMDMGMHKIYISCSNDLEEVVYPHDSLRTLLKSTFGIMVYQEQVMEAVKILGGFTDVEADNIRRAMGKKKIELLNEVKDKFIEYAVNKYSDIDNGKANKLWDLIYSFGRYGFCHAHAISYSMLAYICMWLKVYYPLEWWSSVLSNEGDADTVKEYYVKNKEMFIMPDINKSKDTYIVDGDKIVIPLIFLTRIGEKAVIEIIKRQPYSSFRDFLNRTDRRLINKKVVMNLVWSDVFSNVNRGDSNKELLKEYYYFMANGKSRPQIAKILEEYSKDIESLNRFDIINKKIESCPIYDVNCQEYFKDYFSKDVVSLDKILKFEEECKVKVGGIFGGIKVIKTKTNKPMAFANLRNNNCSIDLVLFPEVYDAHKDKIKNNLLSEVDGKFNVRNNKKSIIVNGLKFIEV